MTKIQNITSLTKLKRSYEKIWTRYELMEEPSYYEWIISLFGNVSNKKLLDIGCGGGYLLEKANIAGMKTTGIDISKKAIEKAQKRAFKSELIVGAAEKLSFKNKHFDFIVCLGSLEHFLKPEKALSEMYRVLKDNGLLCIVLPNRWAIDAVLDGVIGGIELSHGQELERYYSYNKAVTLLTENQFTIEKVLGYNRPFPNNISTGTKLSYFLNFLYQKNYKYFRWKIPVRISYVFVFLLRKKLI